MCETLYNINISEISIPLNNTFSSYSLSYILSPNFVISGIFGPVSSFVIEPDANTINILKINCMKTISEIKEKREDLMRVGMAVVDI